MYANEYKCETVYESIYAYMWETLCGKECVYEKDDVYLCESAYERVKVRLCVWEKIRWFGYGTKYKNSIVEWGWEISSSEAPKILKLELGVIFDETN